MTIYEVLAAATLCGMGLIAWLLAGVIVGPHVGRYLKRLRTTQEE